jgi:hypothetical protein
LGYLVNSQMIIINTKTPTPIHIHLFIDFLPAVAVCGVDGVAGGGVPTDGAVGAFCGVEAGGSWVAVGVCWLSGVGSIGSLT